LPTTSDKPAPGRRSATGPKEAPLCPISARLAALLKVRLLTAQRGGEVVRMRWADLDLESGWWNIPPSDTKNKRPHRVPLVTDVKTIIEAQRPTSGDDDAEHEREFVFCGLGASVRDRAKKAPAEIARALEIDFRGHDLRRTAATRMAEAGIPQADIARVLNHAEGGPRATQVYNRYEYDREKRIAIETCARRLKAILEGSGAKSVLPFSATGA